ncbi:MAG: redoxin domain-containing protein [Tepidisphaeraceae bacterium]|jgi:peroxiredoxin Q/BCP
MPVLARLTLGIVAPALFASIAWCDPAPSTQPVLKTGTAVPVKYYLSLPRGWTARTTWPIVVTIDGSGHDFLANCRGFSMARGDLPFIVVTPCVTSNDNDPDDEKAVLAIVKEVQQSEHGQPKFFITGFSAGGHLAWQVTFAHPDLLAGVGLAAANFRFRGLSSFSTSPARIDLPIQEFQGDKDGHADSLNQQWNDAAQLAAEHGYKNLTHTMVPGAGHQPFSSQVLRCFSAILPQKQEPSATKEARPARGGTADASPQLLPGRTFTIQFPDMPPTFADLLDHIGTKPQMTVFLPRNYDPKVRHPLLIFLYGGNGGAGGNPGVARGVSEEKDFICVNMPLFKEKVDPPTPDNSRSRILIHDSDCRFAWPLYKRMLAKLEELVPNIDPLHRILGGFSNGAHMTAGLIQESDGEVASRFSESFLVDGGGGLRRFDLLKGKPLLMVCGLWRPNPAPALAAGVKLTVYRMKQAEHAFPQSEYPVLNQWLHGPTEATLPVWPEEGKGTLKVGDRAPGFHLTATEGREYALDQFAGKSAVALCWYLRAGSAGSRTELAAIQAEMEKLSEYRVQVLGITLSKLEDNKAFAAELKLTFPLLSDPQCATAKAYGAVRAMNGPMGPTAERWVILIDAEGIIRCIEKGEDVGNKGRLLLKAIEEAKVPRK